MAVGRHRNKKKHSRLRVAKSKRGQRLLKAGTKTETLEQVPNEVNAERKRNLLARKANERFLRSDIEIIDVYRKLAE